jgi:uncharacterized protein YfkK (UPF0435 family)
VHNVDQIETLTQQLNEYKEKEKLLSGGIFQTEESRMSSAGDKRKYDDIGITKGGTSSNESDNSIWSEFEHMLMSSGGNRGVMDVMYKAPSNMQQIANPSA